jgi:hypothetical protein
MTCHQIFCHISWKFPRGKWIYQKYSMTWHGIFFKILSCSSEQVHLLTCSPISVIGTWTTSCTTMKARMFSSLVLKSCNFVLKIKLY